MCVCVRVCARWMDCLPPPTNNIFVSYVAFPYLYHSFILGCVPLGGGAALVGSQLFGGYFLRVG